MHSVVPIGDYATVGRYVDSRETARRLVDAGVFIPSHGSDRATVPHAG
jgi:hypothetical protein